MENLRALVQGRKLNDYQKALAMSEFNKLEKQHKEANEFIKTIAEMMGIETDGLGYDGLQLSLDDFADAINKLRGWNK